MTGIPSKCYKVAIAEMERWGIRPSWLTAAVSDALQAAFDAKAAIDRTATEWETVAYFGDELTSTLVQSFDSEQRCRLNAHYLLTRPLDTARTVDVRRREVTAWEPTGRYGCDDRPRLYSQITDGDPYSKRTAGKVEPEPELR